MITLILCWRSVHLAAINFQLLNLGIWFDICKELCCACCLWKINHISAFHISPMLNLISTLNWLDSAGLKFWHGGYLSGDMMRQVLVKNRKHIGKEVRQRDQEKTISYDFNCKTNKAHWACISCSDLQTHGWFLDLFVLIERLMCFSKEIAGQVKSPYFKHCHKYPFSFLSQYNALFLVIIFKYLQLFCFFVSLFVYLS